MSMRIFYYFLVSLVGALMVFLLFSAFGTYRNFAGDSQKIESLHVLSNIEPLEFMIADEEFSSALYVGVNGVNYADVLSHIRHKDYDYIDKLKHDKKDGAIKPESLDKLSADLGKFRARVDILDSNESRFLNSLESPGLLGLFLAANSNISRQIRLVAPEYFDLYRHTVSFAKERTMSALYVSRRRALSDTKISYWEKIMADEASSEILLQDAAKLNNIKSLRNDIFAHIDDGKFETHTYDIATLFAPQLDDLISKSKDMLGRAMDKVTADHSNHQTRLMLYAGAIVFLLFLLFLLLRMLSSSRREKIALEESLKEIAHELDDDQRKELELIVDRGDRAAVYRFLAQMTQDARDAEERALEAEKAKDLFLANMSHEIRTPLNGILGFTQLMRSTDLDSEQTEFMEVIESSSNNLLKIVNDILDLSKIRANMVELESIPFSVTSTMEKAVEPHAARALDKGIEYSTFIDPTLPKVMGDPTKLSQVLTNLIGNAIKFTSESGTVDIDIRKIKEDSDTVSIRFGVKDSGIGISKEQIEKIFEPFSQADVSTTREFGGTGLGLTITRDIIGHMGGKLSVNSVPCEGSEFYFELHFENAGPDSAIENRLEGMQVAYYHSDGSILRQMERNLALYIRASGGRYRTVGDHELDLIDDIDVLILDFGNKKTRDNMDRLLSLDKKVILISTAADKADTDLLNGRIERVIYRPLTASKLIRTFESLETVLDKYPHAKPAAEKISLDGMKILVAEDNQINQKLIMRVLGDMGVVATLANDGQEAYDLFKTEDFDAVMMDIQMPVMGGVESAQKIIEYERDHGSSHTPIIALTANALQGDRAKYIKKGFDDYISKPINLDQLGSVLGSVIEQEKKTSAEPVHKAATENAATKPNKMSVLMFSTSGGLIQRLHHDALTFAGYDFKVTDSIEEFFDYLGKVHPYQIIVDAKSIGDDECMLVELLKGRDASIHVFGSLDTALSCSSIFEEYSTVAELLAKIS